MVQEEASLERLALSLMSFLTVSLFIFFCCLKLRRKQNFLCRKGRRAFSSGSKRVLLLSAAEDHEICIWSTAKDFEAKLASYDDHDSPVDALAAIGDGLVASASKDGTIYVWRHSDSITNLGSIDTLSPINAISSLGGGLLVTGSETGNVSIWRLETGECLCTFEAHTDKISSLAVLADGRMIIGSMDWTCSIYRSSRRLGTLQGHLGPVYAVVALSSGEVASASADRSIRIWSLEDTSTCQRTLSGHKGHVLCLATVDSTEGFPLILSGSGDQTLRIWRADRNECLKSLQGHSAPIHSLVVLDRTGIASGSGDGQIIIWCLDQGAATESIQKTLIAHPQQKVQTLVVLADDRVAAMDAQAEMQATGMLETEKVDLVLAAELLQGGPPPEQSVLADLHSKAVDQASTHLQEICSKGPSSVHFNNEANNILKSHPELTNGTGIVPHCPFSAADVALAGLNKAGTAELFFLAGPAGLGGSASLKAAVGTERWTSVEQAVSARLRWACQKRLVPGLRYAILLSKHLDCGHLPEYAEAAAVLCELARLPREWDVAGPVLDQHRRRGSNKGVVDYSSDVWISMQELLDQTFDRIRTQDRAGKIPSRLELQKLFWVQNESTWEKYRDRRDTVRAMLVQGQRIGKDTEEQKDLQEVGIQIDEQEITMSDVRTAAAAGSLPILEDRCRERWLWHGTTSAAAEKIAEQGFSMELAGSGAGTLYGHGIYFTECSSKADEYANQNSSQECMVLLCRAVLGRILYTAENRPDGEMLSEQCRVGSYDSVLGDRKAARGTYREVVLYDSQQVYPEFLLVYQRQYQQRTSQRSNRSS